MDVSSRLAWNSIVAWTSSLIGAVGGFILVRFLVDYLGIENYGVVELLNSLVVFTMLTDLGIRGALGRHLVEHISLKNHRRVNELLTLTALAYVLIGAVLLLVCWFGAPLFVRRFHIETNQYATAIMLVRVFIPAYTLIAFIATSYGAVIESHHRFDIIDATHVVEIVVRISLVFSTIMFGWGLTGWAFGYLAAKLVTLVVFGILAHRLSPTIAIRPRYLNFAASRELFVLGGLMFIYQTVFKLSAQTDPLILGYFINPLAAGLYKPALYVTTAGSPFAAALNRQLRPLATTYFVQGEFARIRELLVRGTKISLLMSLPFTIIFICFAVPLVHLWLKKPEFEITAIILILWSLADIAANASGAQFQVLLGLNRIRYMVAVQTIGALINVMASIAIVGWLAYHDSGMNACIIGVVIPTIVTAWIQRLIITLHVAKVTDIGLWNYLRGGFLPAVYTGVALAFIAIGTEWIVDPRSWTALFVCIAITVFAWIVLSWVIGLDRNDRDLIWRVAFRLHRRFSAKLRSNSPSKKSLLKSTVDRDAADSAPTEP